MQRIFLPSAISSFIIHINIEINNLQCTNSLLKTFGNIKGALPGLRQFLAIGSSLKVMKNAFYFTSKAFSVPKVFKFLSWLFAHVTKQLD